MRFKDFFQEMFVPNKLLLEVDWSMWQDVNKTCMSAEQVAEMLNTELKRGEHNRTAKSKDNKSPNKNDPRFTANTLERSRGENGFIDVEKFIKEINKLPATIFDVGEKSSHTITANIVTVNTGIPAFRAILWDEEQKEFFVINTCPAASKCASYCYAMQGYYIINDGKNLKLVNRLQLLLNDPVAYEKQAYRELESYAWHAKRDGKTLQIRWNDAGDFFSDVYMGIAVKLHKKLIAEGYNVKTYAYSKLHKMIEIGKSFGFSMNFSTSARKADVNAIDFATTKISDIIPKEVFKEFFISSGKGYKKDKTGKTLFRNSSDKDAFKAKVVAYYNNQLPIKLEEHQKQMEGKISLKSLIFTDELPLEEGDTFKYNVIVLPGGDSDISAQRTDVHYTLLCMH